MRTPLLFTLLFLGMASTALGQSNTNKLQAQSLFVKILDTIWSGNQLEVMLQVKDRDGNFVGGLADGKRNEPFFTAIQSKGQAEICPDFRVLEADESNSPIPINFSLVLDYSGSMSDYINTVKEAGQAFIDSLSNSNFARVNFDDRIVIINEKPTKNPTPVYNDDYDDYAGYTALIAATDAGVQTLKDAVGTRFVVIFTDGLENGSDDVLADYAKTEIDLINNAKENNVAVYTLSFGLDSYSLLENVSYYTGGAYYNIDEVEDLSSIFNDIREAYFSNFYIVQATCKEKINDYVIEYKDPATGEKIRKEIEVGKKVEMEENSWGEEVIVNPKQIEKPFKPIDAAIEESEFQERGIDLEEVLEKQEQEKEAQQEVIEEEVIPFTDTLNIGEVIFQRGSSVIPSDSISSFDMIANNIAQLLKNHQDLVIEIHGHASPDGDQEDNKMLSEDRATSVFAYIVSRISTTYSDDTEVMKGLSRVFYRSYGEDKPLFGEQSEDNARNRRVEIWAFPKEN